MRRMNIQKGQGGHAGGEPRMLAAATMLQRPPVGTSSVANQASNLSSLHFEAPCPLHVGA